MAGKSQRSPQRDALLLITPQDQIDAALSMLQEHKDTWIALDVCEHMAILDHIRRDFVALANRWITAECRAKGIAKGTFGEAEEWLFFAAIMRAIRRLRQAMSDIQRAGRPSFKGPIRRRANGQVVAQVFPQTGWERLFFSGMTGEVWMEPGVSVESVLQGMASAYREKKDGGKVALVLGAGNASMLPVVDVLHKLFVDRRVVVLKLSPVNAHLGPLMEEGLRALIARGFLRIVYGGEAEGSYLCQHQAVDELHLTGSVKTFAAITFGSGPEGERRQAARTPLNTRRFTSELGNVSPLIVVPGDWSASDVTNQAVEIATWFVANAGFACLTPRVIIQHEAWPLRNSLVEAIEEVLAKIPTRPAYYPGASERYAAFIQAHPEARRFGHVADGHLPWTFIRDVDPRQADDICFTQESFCSIIAETALGAASVVEFIDRAVAFANTALWGNLNATLIVHPNSLKDPEIATAVERAIAELRYGAVLLNIGPFAAYYFMVTPWGGFPGNNIADIQSGIGKSANALMFAQAQKSVIRAPFKKRLNPVRATSKGAHRFARKLALFEAAPSMIKALGFVPLALNR